MPNKLSRTGESGPFFANRSPVHAGKVSKWERILCMVLRIYNHEVWGSVLCSRRLIVRLCSCDLITKLKNRSYFKYKKKLPGVLVTWLFHCLALPRIRHMLSQNVFFLRCFCLLKIDVYQTLWFKCFKTDSLLAFHHARLDNATKIEFAGLSD